VPRLCSDPPPDELFLGIGQFNAGDWFACHETFEELWAGEPGEARHLYQGILQVAVALHHWREGNFRGAVFLLGSAEGLLSQVTPVCQGVDVAGLLRDTARLREALEALGPDGMGALDSSLIPRVLLHPE
jgi:hypothetical protein